MDVLMPKISRLASIRRLEASQEPAASPSLARCTLRHGWDLGGLNAAGYPCHEPRLASKMRLARFYSMMTLAFLHTYTTYTVLVVFFAGPAYLLFTCIFVRICFCFQICPYI